MSEPLPAMMTAIEIASPGGPDALKPASRPLPRPSLGEVLVKVAAAGVNRPDVLQRQGRYAPPPGTSDIPGLEFAGTVVAVGPGVTSPAVGDKVCALVAGGGYAEYAAAPAPQAAVQKQAPLRIFLRGGPKTHGPADNGLHDGPTWLKEWKPLLESRGASVNGALRFPTADELKNTDVLVMFAAGIYLAHYTRFGRTAYAMGGSEQSALLMGLPVARTKVLIYVLSGFCSALAGVCFTFYMLSGYGLHAKGLEMDAIAAAVVGGTLLTVTALSSPGSLCAVTRSPTTPHVLVKFAAQPGSSILFRKRDTGTPCTGLPPPPPPVHCGGFRKTTSHSEPRTQEGELSDRHETTTGEG